MKAEEIQEKIERTRDEMASTLHAIERKLSPKQLMDQAVDTMKDFASDQTRVGAMVRENPVPLALLGIGIGWLAVSGLKGRDKDIEAFGGADSEGAASAWSGPGAEEVPYSPITAERLAGLAEKAREGVGQAADITRRRVTEWSHDARHQASEAATRTREAYEEHPLTMGAVAMLLGAALGAIIPLSAIEARRSPGGLASRASRAIGRTVEKAKEGVEKAKEGAIEGLRAARDTIKEEIKTPPSGMTH